MSETQSWSCNSARATCIRIFDDQQKEDTAEHIKDISVGDGIFANSERFLKDSFSIAVFQYEYL